MKICLINPPWLVKKGNIWRQIRSIMPPLGLLYLASSLEKENIEVEILDFQANFSSWEQIENTVKLQEYEFYGITSTTPIINNSYRISKIIKKHYPNSKVIFGGVHVTALPEEALGEKSIDFVIRGEGENSLLELMKGTPFENIPGLSYRKEDKFYHIKPDGLISDLDSLPFPAFHKINLKLYKPAFGAYKNLPAINMMATRGCLGKCTFCNSANIQLRKRSAENIFSEMKILANEYGIREIQFYDDTFTVYHDNIDKLCDLLITNKIKITWCCFARTDCVTQGLLNKMKRAGCHQVMYGIETVDAGILKNIKKNINSNNNIKAIEMAKKAGITVRCTFMFGNPGETPKTIDDTIRYSIQLDPDIALYNITTPYPGTEMFNWAEKNEYLVTKDWADYDLSYPVMQLPTISMDMLNRKYKQAFRDFYFRPKFMINRLFKKSFSCKDILTFIEGLKKVWNF